MPVRPCSGNGRHWTLPRRWRNCSAILPTLEAGVFGNEVVTATASAAAQKDPRLVLDWLGTIPVAFRIAPAIAAARKWATQEPSAALDWCIENGVDVARWTP